jgi:hypothetical protein
VYSDYRKKEKKQMCQHELVELAAVVTSLKGQHSGFGSSSNHSASITPITKQNLMCAGGSGENYIMSSLMICTPHPTFFE